MDPQAIAQNRFDRERKVRPSAQRLAARAAVLSTIVCRAYLEQEFRQGDKKNAPGSGALMDWLIQSGRQGELEPDERRFQNTAVGEADDQDLANAFWRTEGLGERAMADQEGCLQPQVSFILAGAHAQRGERDEAGRWLDLAVIQADREGTVDAGLRRLWSEAAEWLGRPGPAVDAPGPR